MKKSPSLLLDMGLDHREALNARDVFEAIVTEGTAVIGATLGARAVQLRWQWAGTVKECGYTTHHLSQVIDGIRVILQCPIDLVSKPFDGI
jgi:hypothetical protein